jgi:hypothetical protein
VMKSSNYFKPDIRSILERWLFGRNKYPAEL